MMELVVGELSTFVALVTHLLCLTLLFLGKLLNILWILNKILFYLFIEYNNRRIGLR